MRPSIPGGVRGALAGLGLGVLAVGSGSAEEEWRRHGPERCRFQVEFPAEPELSNHEARTVFGSVRETRYTLRTAEGVLIAECHELPAIAVALMADRALLDRARAGVIESQDGIPIESRDLDAEVPAQQFSYRLPGDPPRYQRARTFLDGSRLYLLLGTTLHPNGAAPRVERFFESFRFGKDGEKPPEPVDPGSPSE